MRAARAAAIVRPRTPLEAETMSTQHVEDPSLADVSRDVRTPGAAGVAGLAFAALFAASILLLRKQPGGDSTASEIQRWYLENDARHLALVGLYLAPFSGIAFLWFMAVIRQNVGDREDRFFETVFLGSGLLFVAMTFAAIAVGGGPLVAVRFQHAPVPGPETISLVRGVGYAFLYVYGVRAAAVFVVSVSTIGRRTRTLPHWLVRAGYALALVMLVSVSFYRFVVLLFPLWVAVVSVVILARAAGAPTLTRSNGVDG
jgi:hypothetical protein